MPREPVAINKTRIIGASGADSRFRSTQLPTELRALARRRLLWVTVALAAIFGGFTLLGVILTLLGDQQRVSPVDASLFALSLALIFVIRSPRVSDRVITYVGLCFMVVMVALIQIGNIRGVWMKHGHIPTANFGTVLIVALPLIVPANLRQTIVAATIAAATGPLAVLLIRLAEGPVVTADDYLDPTPIAVVAAFIAVAGSRLIYGLGIEVARARRLGAYQLTEMLGKGGMGEVWRAEHRFLARPAAIKLIRPREDGAQDPLRARRFEREAQVTSQLHSPHTVELYDFGVSDEGAYFYVMELLDGVDLDRLVRDGGAQPAERVIEILLQVCHSLDEAHDAGLVHRDIKPANIYLCQHGRDADVVKVLDFGLVALQPGRELDSADLTADNVVHGTPSFLPPEMVVGQDDIGPAADLYALGCVAYWLLTGSLVFDSEGAVAQIADHLHTAPRPMSERGVEVPPDLEALVLSCLAKKPEDRPGSAAALAASLAACHPGHTAPWWEARS